MNIKTDKKSALVIDDFSHSQNIFCLFFEELGWPTPTVVPRGEEALILLKEAAFDIVILDIKLPGIDGWEVLKRAQKLPRTPPIIMVTGNEDSNLEGRAYKLGVDGFIYKNKLNQEDFDSAVDNAIKQHEKKAH